MSHIPDCRTDEYYNEKYLREKDREFIRGYDWIVEQVIGNFFSNLDIYPEAEQLLDDQTAVIKEGKAKIIEEALRDYLEMERDEMITSMIDSMDEDEFTAIKAAVDSKEG